MVRQPILRGIIELFVWVENYRNIDLYYQGDYFLRISIADQEEKPAQPYHITSAANPFSQLRSTPTLFIEADSPRVITKKMQIKYHEEQFIHRSGIHFRYECDLGQPKVLTCKVKLYIGHNGELGTDGEAKTSVEDQSFYLKYMGEMKFKIDCSQFVGEYFAVTFEDKLASVVDLAVFGGQFDYRLRNRSILFTDFFKMKSEKLLQSAIKQKNYPFTSQQIGNYANQLTLSKISSQMLKALLATYQAMYDQYYQLLNKAVLQNQLILFPKLKELPVNYINAMKHLQKSVQWYCSCKLQSGEPDSKKLLLYLLQEVNTIGTHTFSLWLKLIYLIKASPVCVKLYLSLVFKEKALSLSKLTTKRCELSHIQLEHRLNQSSALRKIVIMESGCEQSIHLQEKDNPIIFYDLNKPLYSWAYKGLHLVILVHGFQGYSADLRTIKRQFLTHYPQMYIISSKSNEFSTGESIVLQGKRLAEQVLLAVQKLGFQNVGKVSFCAHSMGGLVVRTALAHLARLKTKMGFFLTLSSPHLGIKYSQTSLFSTGLWFVQKFNKSQSLAQMAMAEDNLALQQQMLYQLSRDEGIGWFKFIILVGSPTDQYAAQPSSLGLKIDSVSEGELKMQQNLQAQLQKTVLIRAQVHFPQNGQMSIDSMIGRTAHIRFLQSNVIITRLLLHCPQAFD